MIFRDAADIPYVTSSSIDFDSIAISGSVESGTGCSKRHAWTN
jgi:hypothetical protein